MVTKVGNQADFEKALANAGDQLVVVDFFADWCGPCQYIAPTIVNMAAEYQGRVVFLKVDVENNKETTQTYGINCMPTFLFYRNGKKLDEKLEGANDGKLREIIQKQLSQA